MIQPVELMRLRQAAAVMDYQRKWRDRHVRAWCIACVRFVLRKKKLDRGSAATFREARVFERWSRAHNPALRPHFTRFAVAQKTFPLESPIVTEAQAYARLYP